MQKERNLLRKIIYHYKWFIGPTVLVLYLSSAILMMIGISKLYFTITDIINSVRNPGIICHATQISANFLSIIENYILSMTFYILAVGIYKLFIGNHSPSQLLWIQVKNINDLKSQLSKMSVLFLCLMLIQKVSEWRNPIDTFYFGIIVVLICVILIWFSKHLDKSER